MEFEVIIIGGSFAGQAAALQLARARRRILIVDSGKARNRFARTSHGFLGQDGLPPAVIMTNAREQLLTYPTVLQKETEVLQANILDDGFEVILANDLRATSRCLILATGVRDILPDIQGLEERWGVSVLHCPYCHGYELNRNPIGVIASNALALHQAMLVPDWGPTTLFLQNNLTLTQEEEKALLKRNVTIEQTPITSLHGKSPDLEAVHLADGRKINLSGLFIAPETSLVDTFAEALGLEIKPGMTGPMLSVDERQRTSVPGVFAAGDMACPMPNATLAAASGILAASSAHHALIYGLQGH
ncbi:MAG: NAD(P)/FAD-dependent oxidoreductase [Sneathiellales bacterium]|nr:NAD(P)/FAD-dependent oxidoreductase [Sneathiellales bacterium]